MSIAHPKMTKTAYHTGWCEHALLFSSFSWLSIRAKQQAWEGSTDISWHVGPQEWDANKATTKEGRKPSGIIYERGFSCMEL